MRLGVILYGPPASGKDTITAALIHREPRFQGYQRLKAGGGRTAGYRLIDAAELARLDAQGDILYTNERYGNTYAVDRPTLRTMWQAGQWPVLHLGQVDGITAVEREPARWVRVLLWCTRDTTATRSHERGDIDPGRRLDAWDATRADIGAHRRFPFDLILDTDHTTATDAADAIHHAVTGDPAERRPAGRRPNRGHPMTLPRIMVPVLTLRTPDGRPDQAANAAYAQRAARTWLDLFLINGTIGGGETSTPDERRAVLDIWAAHVPAARLLACTWVAEDLDHAAACGVRQSAVLQGHQNTASLVAYLGTLPAGAYVYSHPNYTPVTFTPDVARAAVSAGVLPAGGKICKVSLTDIAELRAATGPDFALYDGRCRHTVDSVSAGATGVVAVPLCTLPPDLPARADTAALQTAIDRTQRRMDATPGTSARIAMLAHDLMTSALP